jgi:hypothetical protein
MSGTSPTNISRRASMYTIVQTSGLNSIGSAISSIISPTKSTKSASENQYEEITCAKYAYLDEKYLDFNKIITHDWIFKGISNMASTRRDY